SIDKSSKEVVQQLKEIGVNVSNHMSVIDEEAIQKLEGKGNKQTKKEEKMTNQKNKKAKGKKHKGSKGRRDHHSKNESNTETPEKITYSGSLTVGELAEKLNKDASEIIKKLMFLGVMATKNEDLEKETIELIAEDYG